MAFFEQGDTKLTLNDLVTDRLDGGAVPDQQLDAESNNAPANSVVTSEIEDLTPLKYSTIGSEVTIESGYIALADGYFTIANAGATGDFTLTLNSTDIFKYYFDATKPYEKFAFFVKKGMTISWTTGMAGGAYYIRYNPFVASRKKK